MEKIDELPGTVHVEADYHDDLEKREGQQWHTSIKEAQAANAAEHLMTVRQALRAYPWAVIWSLTISMSIIMEGYDTNLIGNFYAYPEFKVHFGQEYAHGYEVPGEWQSALGAGGNAGCILGAFLNGYLVKHYGFKRVFIGGLLCMCGFIFVSFFGKSVGVQVAGQVLCGIPWGMFATIGPAYSSELLPLALRPYLTAYTNMCFAIGQFISMGALKSLLNRPDEWSYRIPYAVQWLWPAPLCVIAIFMPESPWWQVRHGQYAAAEKTVQGLMAKSENHNARQVVAMMIHTDNIESEIEAGSSYLDCLRGSNLRRTEIACVTFAGQVLSGSQFAYSGTYFFEQAGMSADDSYKLALGGTAIAFIGTVLSWFLMKGLGRRSMYLGGMALMCIYLFIIGILDLVWEMAGVQWAQSSLCIIWLFTYSLSVGPLGWSIAPEISSTRLRSKTIVLARNTYYIAIVVANVIEPYFINPTAWNWRGKTGFFWCGTGLATLIWGFFRLTETKGRTFEELDIMFAAKLKTRRFKAYDVDAYAEDLSIKERAKGSR
ncbi:general substrate transporter [Aspergillus spinulosporus]